MLLIEPCLVIAGWLDRIGNAARADTNTASASALADTGTPLALSLEQGSAKEFVELADSVAAHTLKLRPRLSRAVGPCVYVRREALELVGPLDKALDLRRALEVDFAQRCLLSGLAHVAADDVVVQRLTSADAAEPGGLPARLLELPVPLGCPAGRVERA